MSTISNCPAHHTSAPKLEDDPFSFENLEDPLPFQERLREAGPVAYLPQYGVYAIGRFAELTSTLENWQEMISGSGVGMHEPWRARGLLQMDPPEHDAPREVLQEILSSRALRALRESCLERADSVISPLLEGAAGGDQVELDAYHDIASVMPVNFFPDASGISEEGRENLVPYADHIFNAGGPRNELYKKGECRAEELGQWANDKCQRDALKPEGFGADIWAAADRGDITHEFAPLLTRSLLSAGVDTTVYGITGLLYALATYPDQWAALKENPGLARVAFDESLRWIAPVQYLFRKAGTDVRIGSHVIPEGTRVLLSYGAANRDPRRWENPDKFDLSRDPSGHLAFGMGIHQCVGQHAARLQAACLLEKLIERVERIELSGEVEYNHNNALRGWGAVPLRLTLS
ncbi:cytochrome P450 [Arthrobacter sp. MYb211]|uniref:cytochrome P450 n=1 Tax=unclassified Arthrobacter TaxID=235627 RepID=UPI000CFB8E11|nr:MULTISPECIES: cytochrome P450 [unclassified Arthrobacter]PRA11498.1 cytochrome P450 [Arthrobacter sp. MYb221]PRC08001.1 cytochrome P450 [Arthrobacter sp. MYb211]